MTKKNTILQIAGFAEDQAIALTVAVRQRIMTAQHAHIVMVPVPAGGAKAQEMTNISLVIADILNPVIHLNEYQVPLQSV